MYLAKPAWMTEIRRPGEEEWKITQERAERAYRVERLQKRDPPQWAKEVMHVKLNPIYGRTTDGRLQMLGQEPNLDELMARMETPFLEPLPSVEELVALLDAPRLLALPVPTEGAAEGTGDAARPKPPPPPPERLEAAGGAASSTTLPVEDVKPSEEGVLGEKLKTETRYVLTRKWTKFSDLKNGAMYWWHALSNDWFYERTDGWEKFEDETTRRLWWFHEKSGRYFFEQE